MNSFVIGYDPITHDTKGEHQKEESKEEAWVHINLWEEKKLDKKERSNIIIDFGILVENVNNIKAIKIYSPYPVKEVADISVLLKQNNELITAVFNENYIHNSENDEYTIQPHKGEPFILSPFNEINITKVNDHHIMLNVEEIKKGRSYFRIRLTIAKEKCIGLLFNHKSNGSLFSDFFTSTEIIDFRLNDKRSSGSTINVGNLFNIRSVNIFILRDPSEVVIYHGDSLKNSRYLELDIWKKYGLPDGLIAYHFYRKAERIYKSDLENPKPSYDYEYINHFSILARFQYNKPRRWKIILVTAVTLLVTLLLGFISGFIANYFFYTLFQGAVNSK